MQTNKNIMDNLDSLRIIAACAVVVLHYADYVKDHTAGRFMVAHTQHLNLFVDLFFVVSGFVIASQYLGKVATPGAVMRFLWRRLARIYPLHLATLAFYVVIAVALYLGLAKTDNPARYPLHDIPAQLLLAARARWRAADLQLPKLVFVCGDVLLSRLSDRGAIPCAAPADGGCTCRSLDACKHYLRIRYGNRTVGGMDQQRRRIQSPAGIWPWDRMLSLSPRDRALASDPGVLVAALAGFILFGWLLPEMAGLIAVYAIAVLAIQYDSSQRASLLTRLRLDRGAAYTYSCYMLHIPIATIVLTFGARFAEHAILGGKLGAAAGRGVGARGRQHLVLSLL